MAEKIVEALFRQRGSLVLFIVLNCGYDCNCNYVVIIGIAGKCGKMRLMWQQLLL